jgi:hypothetical protein
MRCLQGTVDRWQRTDDLLAVLESLATTRLRRFRASAGKLCEAARGVSPALLVSALVAAVIAIGSLKLALRSRSAGSRVTSERARLDPSISPDGRTIAYAAGAAGRMRIFVRQITEGRMVPLMDGSFSEKSR